MLVQKPDIESNFREMKRLRWFFLVIVLIGMLVFLIPASAQTPTPTTQPVSADAVNAIAKQMYCPVCENTPLDVCPTQACAEWRELIRDKLEAGWSEEQIKQYFVQQYGARVLATPPPSGLNWLVYVIPPLAFLAAAYILYKAIRSWRRPAAPVVEHHGSAAAEGEYLSRLEEELRKKQE